MSEIKCSIIQDLLPLYVDEVVSEDTKLLVNEHIETCEDCKSECEQMKVTLLIPIENKSSLFSKLNKRWRQKKMLLILGSILTTALLGFALFSFVFHYSKTIPYSADLFKLEEAGDGTLTLNYFGESHYGSYMTYPLEVEIEGEVKKIILINIVKTIADSPTRKSLIKSNGKVSEAYGQFTLPDSQYADAIYYGEFDINKVRIEKKQTWEELLQEMTLIWER